MGTHPDIGLVLADLLQLARFRRCSPPMGIAKIKRCDGDNFQTLTAIFFLVRLLNITLHFHPPLSLSYFFFSGHLFKPVEFKTLILVELEMANILHQYFESLRAAKVIYECMRALEDASVLLEHDAIR